MNSYIQLGLDLGLLEKIEINLGNQKFTGYGILKVEDKVYENLVKEISDGKYNHTLPLATGFVCGTSKAATAANEAILKEKANKPVETIYCPPGFEEATAAANKFLENKANLEKEIKEAVSTPLPPTATQEQLEAQQALARMTGDAPVAEKKKRGRPKKETFTLTEPEVPKAEAATAPATPKPPTTSDESASALSMVGESKTLEAWQTPAPLTATLEIGPAPEPEFEGKPTADQARDFRMKLTRFADDVLPAAGLVPSQGVGGVRAKIKLYIKKKFGVEDTKLLTIDQWALLINEIESVVLVSGASAMVKIINDEIGAA